ncbi:hypothetical protein [Flammeovirga aprica]|uniref:Cytochrome c domain-containing protein n=1 Tax=Flammeovirga aprica JL-4 TaxID=694437 RepID=A0A7X9XBM8_9BACT|nr:hypothetical protein [Flammeovirga aprica]NME70887.1 hypothetical protein [Flammeovirga aprica JL-4]
MKKELLLGLIPFIMGSCQIQKNTIQENLAKDCVLSDEKYQTQQQIHLSDIRQWIEEEKITSIEDLISELPEVYRKNFSLVEHTKALGESNLDYPRIVLFGGDGHLLFNISSKLDDPTYQKVDGIELNEETGNWELFQVDFSQAKIKVHDAPQECFRCHGEAHPKPLWGTSSHWKGVFGDNEAPGPNGEALSLRHLQKMNAFRDKNTDSPRLKQLIWDDEQVLRSGGIRNIKDNRFGAELIASNHFIGASVAKGIYIRMEQELKDKKAVLPLLLLTAQMKEDIHLGKITQQHFVSNNTPLHIDSLYLQLGINTETDFTINNSLEDQEVDKLWKMGKGTLYEQVALLTLYYELMANEELKNLFSNIPAHQICKSEEHTITNLYDLVKHKVNYHYLLKGNGKVEASKVYIPMDDDEVFESVLQPAFHYLQNYYSVQNQLL